MTPYYTPCVNPPPSTTRSGLFVSGSSDKWTAFVSEVALTELGTFTETDNSGAEEGEFYTQSLPSTRSVRDSR